MKHLKIARSGIAALLLATALLVACTSSDQQSQPDQTQESSSASQTAQSDDQSQTQPQRTEPQDQQSAAVSDDEEDQGPQDAQSRQSNDARGTQSGAQEQDEEATVAAADQQRDEAQAEPAEQAQPQQAQDQPAQQQDQQQDQQQAQADDSAEQQEQQPQPEAEQADQQDEPAQQQEQSQPSETDRLRLRAEEISALATVSDLVGINAWLNGAETSVALELAKGNVVLIDFWTYTCINCVRTLPFLTSWDQKYRDHGLVIIGVHTPEFEFEERIENVRAAIAEHDIEYLVAVDNDWRTWRALQGRSGWWPRKFLIGPTPDGSPMGVRYDHIGEGDYEETEVAIRAALEAVGKDLSDVPFGVDVAVPTRGVTPGRQTRELYAGWSRNNGSGGPYAGQEAYFLAGPLVPTFYSDIPTSDRKHNLWYLQGLWETDRESIVHARETDDLEDYIALLIRGRTANVVLTVAEDGEPFNVYVELDGRWLQPDEAGSHIQWDDDGRSYIRVTENDLYRLVFLPEWSEHELKLRSDSDQFRIFAFTFGSYVGGE
ncbi:MAG: redoxin domain-containing protein [Chloroflexota bacterium]|nr:redoxin domain-containing protein [Chloroflexota bacterium]